MSKNASYICGKCGASNPLQAQACAKCGAKRPASPQLKFDDELLNVTVGGYQLSQVIGQGGMGRVYKAQNPKTGKLVAVKVLLGQQSQDPVSVARFFDEARIVNQIRHPNIVEVFELSTLPDGRPYLLMEFLEGENFERYLKAKKKLPANEAIEIFVPICEALDAAHQKKIVHRDLKPENIFLAKRGAGRVVKLLDFGIAKLNNPDGNPRHTKSGMLLGTPRYMSPEQAVTPRDVDGRSDVYAVGAMLYEAVAGRPPFDASSTVGLLFQHRDEPPPAPIGFVPDLPPALNDIILRCLEKSPGARFARAKELAEALRGALGVSTSDNTSQSTMPPLRPEDLLDEGNQTQQTDLPEEFVKSNAAKAAAKAAEKAPQAPNKPGKDDSRRGNSLAAKPPPRGITKTLAPPSSAAQAPKPGTAKPPKPQTQEISRAALSKPPEPVKPPKEGKPSSVPPPAKPAVSPGPKPGSVKQPAVAPPVLAESEPAQAEAEENNQFAASEVTRIERVESGAQVRVPPAALDEPDEETRLNGKPSATPGVSVQAASGPRNTGTLKTAEAPSSPRPTGTLKAAEPPASTPGRPTGTLPKASPPPAAPPATPPAAPPAPSSPRPTGTLKATEPPKAAEPPLAMSPEDTPTPPPLPTSAEDTPTPPPLPAAAAKSAPAKRSEPPKKARPEFETPTPRGGASFENEDDFAPTPSVVRMLKGKDSAAPRGESASSGGAWKNWVMAFLGLGLVGVSGAWAAWPQPKAPVQECPKCTEPPPPPPAECAEVAAALLPTNPPAGLVEVPLSLNPNNARVMLFVDREWRYLKTGTSKLSLPKGASVEVVVAAPGYFPERYVVDTSKPEGLKVALKEDPKASVKKKPGN